MHQAAEDFKVNFDTSPTINRTGKGFWSSNGTFLVYSYINAAYVIRIEELTAVQINKQK